MWRQRQDREEDVREDCHVSLMVLMSQLANALPLVPGSRTVGHLISVVF